MEPIFLACFVFGALFTLISVVVGFGGHGLAHLGHGVHGAVHGPGHVHADLGHGHAGHVHTDLGNHDHGHPAPVHGAHTDFPWLNASSAIGGLTWFGAAGYLLTRLGDWAGLAVFIGALLAGGVGWYLVARFLGWVLAGEREMDPADYRLEGTVGQLTVSIPAGGTGEVVFSKVGSRRSEAARALDGAPIARGSEVVITSYVDGFATVQPWGEFLAARERAAAHNREAQEHA
jgi:hypothetical protein